MPARSAVASAVGLVAALALGGCAVTANPLGDARDAGVSATGSAVLALELRDDGRATSPTTDTVLVDSLHGLTDASRSITERQAADPDEQAERDAIEDALRTAVDAVTGSRAAVARGDDLAPWLEDLAEARDALAGAER